MLLYNIPVFCPEDSESNDIKPTAMSRFASYIFIVKYSAQPVVISCHSVDSLPFRDRTKHNSREPWGGSSSACNISVFYEAVLPMLEDKVES